MVNTHLPCGSRGVDAHVKIGLVAGEKSGDRLAAGLMRELQRQLPEVEFIGIGGPTMLAAGLQPISDWHRLNINGFVEPVLRLPHLYQMYHRIMVRYSRQRPDVFVGVDFNVFNLLLEKALKKRGIPTVHYVSPSVYAWRRGRIKSIAKAADTILTLFPFEPELYRQYELDAVFVGHPLADEIDFDREAQMKAARRKLGLNQAQDIIALLPGSRRSEIRHHGRLFLAAAMRYREHSPDAGFLISAASAEFEKELQQQVRNFPQLDVRMVTGNSRHLIAAADALICKSGTSTLEALLLGKPMVVSYRLSGLNYRLVKALLQTPWVGLPNLLAGRSLVPELLQEDATPERLAAALREELRRFRDSPDMARSFTAIHRQLRRGANVRAAAAVLKLLNSRRAQAVTECQAFGRSR